MIQDIELRFVNRQTYTEESGLYKGFVRVLQWRKLIHDPYWNEAKWTDWQDVPLVKEE